VLAVMDMVAAGKEQVGAVVRAAAGQGLADQE
jgi:hypothetical protein